MAEALFNKIYKNKHTAFSAGVKSGPEQSIQNLLPLTQFVIDSMNEEGVDVSERKRVQFTNEMIEEADRVVCILDPKDERDQDYIEKMEGRCNEVWPIPNPKGTSLEFHRKVRDEIKNRILGIGL